MVLWVDRPLALIEFPADDSERARRFWSDLLGVELAERSEAEAERSEAEGRGWQTHTGDPAVGIHERGTSRRHGLAGLLHDR
jgi:catechol 2,3-dioxygenase-like lactoylglutathione lyase family enzyme